MSNGPSAIHEQKERREIIAAERKLRQGDGEPQTFFARARARAGLDDTDVPGGRYAAQQAHFPGEGSYPAAAGWTRDAAMVPPEPSLGVAIDEMEVTGTAVEVARSLDELANPTVVSTARSNSQMNLADGVGHPSPPEVFSCSSAREAEPVALVVSSANDNPMMASSPIMAQPGSAISPEDEATLRALLGRGLKRRRL